MKAKWALFIPFMMVIVAIALHTTYARGTQPGSEQNAEGFIANIPAGVRVIPDIAYREGKSKAWRLDLAMPKEQSDEPRPALVFVHGGGWRGGDKRKNNFLGPTLEFAAKGYVCITVNYRLSGEAPMPAYIEDVKCSVRWLRAHAEEYNVDPDRIGAYGNSAGAHLVAMLGLCPPSAGLEGDGPWREYSSMVQAVVCSATPTKFPFRREVANEKTDSAREKSFRSTLFAGPEETLQHRMRQASPMTYVTAEAPPFLIIHGTADKTVPVSQSDGLVKALREAGAKDVTYMRVEGAGHGAFGQNIEKTGPAREAFFARTLKNKGVPNQGQSAQQKTAQLFERNDSNKDGQLSREEFPEAKRRLFDRIDTDKDGDAKITKDEAEGQLKTNFERNDANKDGFLDRGELDALSQRWFGGRSRGRTPGDGRPAQQPQQQRPQEPRPSSSLEAIKERIPDGVKFVPDIAYREGNEAWKLDLAMPKERGDAPRPAIVYIHGGGWTKGDKRGKGIGAVLDHAAKGFVCISVNYRLDVDKKACVEDVKCATRWLRAHAEKYNVDPNRIGAAGGSAGAHLALMLAVCPASAGLEGDGPYQEYSSMVQSAHCSSTPIMPGFRRGKGANEDVRKIQPMTYISADVPPLYLIHGSLDEKAPVSYVDDFVKALRQAGAKDITYKRYADGTGHGAYVKHIEEARPAREAFFARTLRK